MPCQVVNNRLPEIRTVPSLYTIPALVVTDVLALGAALWLAWEVRLGLLPMFGSLYNLEVTVDFYHHLLWVLVVVLSYLAIDGLYTSRLPFWRETGRALKVITLSFLLILASISLGKMSGEFSRSVLVLCCLFALLLLPVGRWAMKSLLWQRGWWDQPVLVLGAGKTGALVAQALLRDRYLGYQIRGFLDDEPAKQKSGFKVNGVCFPVLGGFADYEQVMAETGVSDLIVAAPGMASTKLVDLVNSIQRIASSVTVVPDLFGLPVEGVKADYFFDEQMLTFRLGNNLANPVNRIIKRCFDFIIGLLISIILLPLLAAIALAVKLDSPGPVLFAHRRVGRNGRRFNCYKFRSMAINAQEVLSDLLENNQEAQQEWQYHYKIKNDPRITRVGKFLRSSSLDELPQLLNVLRGEMSLVGPRPITDQEIPYFGNHIENYYLVRPGITGLWQVSGRSEMDYEHRVSLESWYVRNWSLWTDISLLIRTLTVLISKCGAY
ncbi:MAG: undecaprenyl-phosphate galactose phosphotransferase WbaP [Thermacetogeniaceae bacterium]